MPTKHEMTEWYSVLLPFVEEYFGPIPQFVVIRKALTGTAVEKASPFEVDDWPNRRIPTVIAYPERIEMLLTEARGEDQNASAESAVYLLYSCIHELMHVYQPFPAVKADNWDGYRQWVEGSAELATYRLLAAKDRRIRDLVLTFRETLDIPLLLRDIRRILGENLGEHLANLRRHNEIQAVSPGALALPFVLHEDTRTAAARAARIGIRAGKRPDYHGKLRYALGMRRLGILIRAGHRTMRDILTEPISDRDLRLLARSLDRKH